MERFLFFDHTADVGIKAFGRTLSEAFQNAALAVFELITDTSKVKWSIRRNLRVKGTDLDNLLYNWIESLLVLYDSELLLFSRFDVRLNEDPPTIDAEVWGEKFNREVHEPRMVVKAMTYHMMEISLQEGFYTLTFVVDI
jgi:Uncharacterized conserved protein